VIEKKKYNFRISAGKKSQGKKLVWGLGEV
jgi:hypothetical protein